MFNLSKKSLANAQIKRDQEATQKRVDACNAELEKLLEKYGCALQPVMQYSPLAITTTINVIGMPEYEFRKQQLERELGTATAAAETRKPADESPKEA